MLGNRPEQLSSDQGVWPMGPAQLGPHPAGTGGVNGTWLQGSKQAGENFDSSHQ